MRYLFVLLLLVSQGVISQGREVMDGEEYVVSQLLLDAGKGGIGLGAIEKKNNYEGRLDLEIVQIDGPDIIINGTNLGPMKSIRVDIYRFVDSTPNHGHLKLAKLKYGAFIREVLRQLLIR